jgi:Fe-S-cluster containining protein
VIINVCDLVRLVAPLGMEPSSMCDLTETDSRNGEPVLIGDTKKHMVLRHRDSDFCQLLLEIDGQQKCGVHAIRPQICRIYPFSYQRGSMRYEMGHIVCPTEWVVSDEMTQNVLDAIETHEQDRATDRRIVRQWNEETPEEERTPARFWRYAMKAAGEALNVDVAYLFEEPARSRLKEKLW